MTHQEKQRLTDLIRDGYIRSLTIDANIFVENSLSLTGGTIGQLVQFKNSRFSLVLSEIVIREISRRIAESHQESLENWKRTARKLRRFPSVGDEVDDLNSAVAELPTAKDIARWEVDAFLVDTGAEVISADHASMENMLNLYFDGRPPFEPGKRNEFPDAIALLGIEAWTRASRGGMLVVSKDGGWKRFCQESDVEGIFVLEDIATALSIINESEGVRAATAQVRWKCMLDRIQSRDFALEGQQRLKTTLLEESQATGHSHLAYAVNIFKVELSYFRYENGQRVRDDDSALSIILDVYAHVTFWAQFSFFNADKTKSFGQGTYAFGKDIAAGMLVTDDRQSISVEMLVKKDELIIDFGEVEPDPAGETSHLPG
ncbi:PIN domain-containing protein [Rhizobium sp.]|jgi:hypothetical protein|uniref:PIN domain-containing protein n=1 Tax=Rhizobium sp. TaxID=391 RepID=UPI000E8851E2|nr:hypothetical protein [Rhizobium sp.]